MKRILISAGTLVFVGALVASATGAFFSDTETSTGNTFTAGALDLTIDNTSYGFDYNNPDVGEPIGDWIVNAFNSWSLRNLDECLSPSNNGLGEESCIFFNFVDLKPGDYGEDTISLHVQNDAWACMAFNLTGTPENDLNEAEAEAFDVTEDPNGGELQNYLSFLFWYDDGDNVYEDGEVIIEALSGQPGSIFSGNWLAIAEPDDPPLQAGADPVFIGKGWCFGTLTPQAATQDDNEGGPTPGNTGFTCDGSGDNNDAQTDGIEVDVYFYAEQARNNDQFSCSNLTPINPV